MQQPQVTILIPHYKTIDLTKLCLRLLKKYTDSGLVKVIVIDNDSQDESSVYLRQLSWIKLLERQAIKDEGAITAHSRALDLGLEHVDTPYVLSMHTDTLVHHSQWLPFLLSQIKKKSSIAGVGSWKLETKPKWRQTLKLLERRLQLFYYQLFNKNIHAIEGAGKNYYYLRSHCAMYSMKVIQQLGLNFSSGDRVAGKNMHKQIINAGYEMIFIPSETLIKYVYHINHATTLLNPELRVRNNSGHKGLRRMDKILKKMQASQILLNDALDI